MHWGMRWRSWHALHSDTYHPVLGCLLENFSERTGRFGRCEEVLMLRVITVFLILQFSRMSTSFGEDLSDIVSLNANAIERIFSASVRIRLEDRDQISGKPTNVTTCKWFFDRELGAERITVERKSAEKKSASGSKNIDRYSLLIRDDGTYDMVLNFDFENPVKLDPTGTTSQKIGGDTGIVEDVLPGVYDPRGSMLMLVDTAPSRTLAEIVKLGRAKLLGDEVVDGNKCKTIEIQPNASSGLNWTSKVFVDPSVGFMIRKIEQQSQPFSSGGKVVTVKIEATASNFKKLDGEVFLPSTVIVKRSDSKFITVAEMAYDKINSRIPREQIVFFFPEFCWVRELVTGNTYIADGKGGKIASWHTPDEMNQWLREHYPNGSNTTKAGSNAVRLVFVGCIIALSVIVLGYIVMRRRLV